MIQKFIDHLLVQVRNHSIYVWGGQGHKPTEKWIRDVETSEANAKRAIAYMQKQIAAGYGDVLRAYDCSGLACEFLQANDLIPRDMTADNLWRLCDPIKFDDLRPGDFVFRVSSGNAYHIGFVIDSNLKVAEAKGRDYGVCLTKDLQQKTGRWTHYGRPTKIFGGEAGEPEPVPAKLPELKRVLKLTKPYMRGEDVRQAQRFLISALCPVGSTGADGIFGGATDKAVQAYQAEKKRQGYAIGKIDGEIGKKTWTSFGGVWGGK